jgi:muconolactone D-isomerase
VPERLFLERNTMLYLVHMIVDIPDSLPAEEAARIKAEEKAYSQDLQRSGKWPHIWRVVGQYANYSVFDVESNEELHNLLSALPLFPYMQISVTPLATHPSAI